MEKIKLTQIEDLNNIFKYLEKYNYLTTMLGMYQEDPVSTINDLATVSEDGYSDIKDKFINVVEGLKGVNTKDESITIGMKIIKTLLTEYKDKILELLDMLNKDDQVDVLKSNLELLKDISIDRPGINNNKNQLISDKALQEYAIKVIGELLTKVVGDQVSNNVWLNNLLNKTNEVINNKESISEMIKLLNESDKFVKNDITNIDNQSDSEIEVVYTVDPIGVSVPNIELPSDINQYVKLDKTEEVTLINTVIAIYGTIDDLEATLTSNVDNLSSYDYNGFKTVLNKYHDINVSYTEGTVTTKAYLKLSSEYQKLLFNKKIELIEYINKRLSTVTDINNDINFTYLLFSLISLILIESTIK